MARPADDGAPTTHNFERPSFFYVCVWCQRGHDGYLIDFGDIKKVTRSLCKELNEHLIVPTRSDVMQIAVREQEVRS